LSTKLTQHRNASIGVDINVVISLRILIVVQILRTYGKRRARDSAVGRRHDPAFQRFPGIQRDPLSNHIKEWIMQIVRSLGAFSATVFAALLFSQPAFAGPIPANEVEGPLQKNVCHVGGTELAVTCLFKANADGIPMSARTDFVEDWDTIGYDGLTLAEHELFHAIGFTIAYAKFAPKLIATPGAGTGPIPAGSRSYSTNGAANGIKMVLTPAADATHSDPKATGAAPWPATGYDQKDDIMSPEQGKGVVQSLNANDAAILNDAYGYGASGIKINVINLGNSHSKVDMDIINKAVTAATELFGAVKDTSPVFTWTVAEVPEPTSVALLMVGFTAFGIAVRRRQAAR
jgi:hypothetical protein